MKTVIAAALGECVHVAGVSNFLRLAELAGWRTVFLGPAVSVREVISAALHEKADLVGVSYRLTPETGEKLLADFINCAKDLRLKGVKFAFGGTPPVAKKVAAFDFFEAIFDGSEFSEDVLSYLKGENKSRQDDSHYPQTAIERRLWKAPYPLLRHHFGLPTMEATVYGIKKIAEARVLDVISLGTDQDAQENFFRPDRQDVRRKGAGGVPVRSADDFKQLYEASRTGNYPLMRTYSGTDDFIRQAELFMETINNAWCAIPLFWFNRMDGRGPWDLAGSILEHQQVMSWYGERNIPVELNEPHHWGMRDASDGVFVVSAYLSAYNAKKFGVRDYIAQLMFNSPPGTSDAMDLGKMLAVLEMISPLSGPDFRIWLQTRTGLLSYPLEPAAARAHLSSNIYLQMSLRPDIVHIVGHTEADHAATADEIIEASLMARRSIENALRGQPDMTRDESVLRRKEELIAEAKVTLAAISSLAYHDLKDPFTDPETLAKSITMGIMDAPQLKNNLFAKGEARTAIVEGACVAVNANGFPIKEEVRIEKLFHRKVKS